MSSITKKINKLLDIDRDEYSINELLDYFEEDGTYFIIFLTGIISFFFYGTGIIGGIIITLLCIQMIIDNKKKYLPDFILKYKVNIRHFKNKYYLDIGNLFFKKRFTFMFNNFFSKINIIIIFILSLILFIPIMFTGLLPALCISLISISYLFKDGLINIIVLLLSFIVIFMYIFAFNNILLIYIWIKSKKKGIIKLSKYYQYVFLKSLPSWKMG